MDSIPIGARVAYTIRVLRDGQFLPKVVYGNVTGYNTEDGTAHVANEKKNRGEYITVPVAALRIAA